MRTLRDAVFALTVGGLVFIGLTLYHAVGSPGATLAVPKNLPTSLTPGFTNKNVRQSNIQTTVCVKGWTATIRPPSTYTGYLKRAQMAYIGLPGTAADYEEDHFIPLELGGNPFDTRNLWPESWPQAGITDGKENALRQQMCAGTITLAQARSQMIAYKKANG